MNWIYEPWPWYIAGPMIFAVMASLLFFGKSFGVSANLRSMCTIAGAGRFADFFKFDWRSQKWNLIFVLGTIIGGFIAHNYLTTDHTVELNPKTVESLESLGMENVGESYLPDAIFGESATNHWQGWIYLIVGGLLIGFGARYAGGCTSGHAISGLSNLQIPSLIAVIGFFLGGIIMTLLILPKIL